MLGVLGPVQGVLELAQMLLVLSQTRLKLRDPLVLLQLGGK